VETLLTAKKAFVADAKAWCITNGWAGYIEIDWSRRLDVMAWCNENINKSNYIYDGFTLKIRKRQDLVFAQLKWS
jgi:hypothetical protein